MSLDDALDFAPKTSATRVASPKLAKCSKQPTRLSNENSKGRAWIASNEFSIADCATAPALFYALIVEPAKPEFERIASYFERLVTRASFARVLEEARPYLPNFPLFELVPTRFR